MFPFRPSFLPALLLAAALPATALAQYDDFQTWTGFDAGLPDQTRFFSAMELADFDGDGYEDLAAVSHDFFFHALVVHLNHKDATFAPPVYYPIGGGSRELVSGDFDGDGDLDLAVTEGDNMGNGQVLDVFRNQGDGTFVLGQALPTEKGPLGVAAGDFDGDGDLDLVVAIHGRPLGSGTVVMRFANDGTGTFQRQQILPVAAAPYRVAAGDLDGDGLDDAVVVHESNALVSILLSTPTGFGQPLVFDMNNGSGGLWPCVDLVDMDRDGDLDIACADQGRFVFVPFLRGAVSLLENQGGGQFVRAADAVMGANASPYRDLRSADLDGDGWPDLLGAETDGDWSYILGDGAGGFVVQPDGHGIPAGDETVAVAAFDADQDGDLDALVLNQHSLSFSVHRFQGGAPFTTPPAFKGADGDLDAADIDGDGDLDVAGGKGGPIVVTPNLGGGQFGPETYYTSKAFGGPRGVKLRDMDGDGFPDVLLGSLAGFNILVNQGNGTFGGAIQFPIGHCGGNTIGAADLDGDGDLDIVLPESLGCPSYSGPPRIYIGENQGGLQFNLTTFTSTFPSFTMEIVDLDGDGNLDLVLGQNDSVEVHLGNGDLTFQAPASWKVDFGPRAIVVADLNGDGIQDIATANWGDQNDDQIEETLGVLIGLGGLAFAPAVLLPANWSWDLGSTSGLAAGDVDRDGDVDLMLSNYDSGDVSLYRNPGDGNFSFPVRLGAGDKLTDILYADFDGDNVDDIVVSGAPRVTGSDSQWIFLLKGLRGDPWDDLGQGLAGARGTPWLDLDGALVPGGTVDLDVYGTLPFTTGFHVVGASELNLPLFGGTLVPMPDLMFRFGTDARGEESLTATVPPGIPSGFDIVLQSWILDPAAPQGLAATNAVKARTR